jgi:hypothetical protein
VGPRKGGPLGAAKVLDRLGTASAMQLAIELQIFAQRFYL